MIDYNKLVPECLKDFVRDGLEAADMPLSKKIDAGILFTDVTGFTALTEKVSSKGHYSVEIITEILNTYFDKMFRSIASYEGDLIKYGGDSILAIFPGEQAEASRKIQLCLNSMQAELTKLNKKFLHKFSIEISFHGNYTWGAIDLNIVGNPDYHLDYFISGKPLKALFQNSKSLNTSKEFDLSIATLPQQKKISSEILSNFFPEKVKVWLNHQKFTGELKNSSILFIRLENKMGSELIQIDDYHSYYQKLQQIVYFFDGTINKIDYTDKGYLILISFGVPYIHSDDIARAFACSKNISEIDDPRISAKIGLTNDNIYCGKIGAEQRFEFGIIGNAVNISARFMNEAGVNEVIFSQKIISEIIGKFEVALLQEVKVKGIKNSFDIYKISDEVPDIWNAYKAKFENSRLFGYQNLLHSIARRNLSIIYGKSGSGKSHIIYSYLSGIELQDTVCYIQELYEHDQLMNLALFDNIIKKNLMVEKFPEDLLLLKKYIENNQLQIDFAIIAEFFDPERSFEPDNFDLLLENLSDIIVSLLKKINIFVVDNSQWLDQFSFKLLKKIVPKLLINNCKVIISARNRNILMDFDVFNPLYVEAKSFDVAILQQIFQAYAITISPQARNEIIETTDGNPRFVMEILKIIKQNWQKESGLFDTNDFLNLLKEGILPNSLEKMFLEEYAALDNEIKEVLKYASIIGVSFSINLLYAFSENKVEEHLEKILGSLNAKNLLLKKINLPEIQYLFNNALLREAIYQTIPLSEKKSLHLKIAKYYIKTFSKSIENYYEVIANHYILAKSKKNIVKWCLLAGKKNFDLFSYNASLHYYAEALKQTDISLVKADVRLAMANITINQNKADKTAEILAQIETSQLSVQQNDRYYLLLLRLYELQKDIIKFQKIYRLVLDTIQSEEMLLKIKLISLDYFRFNNLKKEFNELSEELADYSAQPRYQNTFIKYYSIMGQYHLDRASYQLAEDNYSRLEKYARELNNYPYQRLADTSLGIIADRQGKQAQAIEYYEKAIAIAEKIGDKHAYGKVLMELAMISFAQGNDDDALARLKNSLEIVRYIGDKQQEQIVLYNFGYIYNVLQNYPESIKYLLQAKDIAQLISDKVGITYANDALGDAYFLSGQVDSAKEIYLVNYQLQKQLADKEGLAHTIGNLANVYREAKQYDKAVEYYTKQQNTLNKLGDKIGEGKAFFNWGITDELMGNKAAALAKLNKAYSLFTAANDQNYANFTQEQIERISKEK